jgi:hypothetical protein
MTQNTKLCVAAILYIAFCQNGLVYSEIVATPAPAGEPLSADFQLTVDSKPVSVYQCRVSAMPFNQVWPGYQRPKDQTEVAAFATWDMDGPAEIAVHSRRPVQTVAIRPTARGIQPKIDGNCVRFRLNGPQQITVEVNGWHQALHLFANPREIAASNRQTPDVRYFGPGIHRPGKIVVQSGQTVYLAAGAVVHGWIAAQNAGNISILGRGVLDTSEFDRAGSTENSRTAGNKKPAQADGSISLLRCTNVTIDGLILRDPPGWCLAAFGCSNVTISNVKLIGLWRYNADGIDVCNSQRVTVRNCFVRSFDDSLVVKGLKGCGTLPVQDVLFEGCVVWNDWGRALEIGAETCAPEITRVTYRNCDIVHTADVALDVQHGDRAAIKDVLFDNVRCEIDDVTYAPRIQHSRDEQFPAHSQFCPGLLVLLIVKTAYSQDKERGTLENVMVRDCSVIGKRRPPSLLQGFDAQHAVRNVTIANMRINGQPVHSPAEGAINIGPHVHEVRVVAP